MQLAVALYNNSMDDEDELEFRKGDILTVLIENPHGCDGWWLCKHKDKCGLCPGNRLKLIQNTDSSLTKSNKLQHSNSYLSITSVSQNKTEMHIINSRKYARYMTIYQITMIIWWQHYHPIIMIVIVHQA